MEQLAPPSSPIARAPLMNLRRGPVLPPPAGSRALWPSRHRSRVLLHRKTRAPRRPQGHPCSRHHRLGGLRRYRATRVSLYVHPPRALFFLYAVLSSCLATTMNLFGIVGIFSGGLMEMAAFNFIPLMRTHAGAYLWRSVSALPLASSFLLVFEHSSWSMTLRLRAARIMSSIARQSIV